MSSGGEDGQGGRADEQTPKIMGLENEDGTPPSEAPVAVKVFTPSTVMAERNGEVASVAMDGYFTPRPAASEIQRHPVFTSSDPTTPTSNPGDATLGRQGKAVESAILSALERPTAHSTNSGLSVQSSESSATITAASSAPSLAPSGLPRPDFPNQAYSALHSQKYPVSRVSQTLKQRGTHPGQIFTFTSALASRHHSGPRTVGASAPVTPGVGLFTPQPLPSSSDWESAATSGTYASPFLHFTQRAQPKETTVADVDVDPISGRKLINHYEIIDELGRGTHGKVKLGRDLSTDGTYVAIKIVDRFSKRRKLGKLGTKEDKVMKEVAILKQVRHPHVTALLEVIDDPTRKKVYIVLEWVELGQIQWRVKGAKEVALVEARRYERERSGKHDTLSTAEDAAIMVEAQRRLAKQRRRHLRSFRQIRQDTPAEIWSNEFAGDDDSGTSDDDKLSRVSTESFPNILLNADGRRSSRTPSPLPPQAGIAGNISSEIQTHYLSLTDEPQSHSPLTSTFYTDLLEGSMYGAYAPYVPNTPGSAERSRGASLQSGSARRRAMTSSERLSSMAAELLDSELNVELGYVPVLTFQQIRIAFRDTLIGLQYLHYQGIIHRDIKPPNLLETKEHRVKISDFGVSYLGRPKGENEAVEDTPEHEAEDLDDGAKELAKTVGTPAFYAPELCLTEATEDAPPITKAIDVWALGVTLFCMLFARTPFVDNEFVVMRQIAEEDIYIPRKRLKPVEPKPRSRPSSQRRAYPPVTAERRHEMEIAYEEIDEDLHNLLKRMLVKDPRKRITLEEVRHHPWVVADIHDKVKWLEETDPSRQSQGKKIEVSKEDVNAAVVPLQFFERVRTTIKNFGERLGFGSKPTSRGRTRSSVGGGIETSPSPSTASAGSNINQDTKRHGASGDDTMLSPQKASRDGEHPLSRSVNVSPEQEPLKLSLNTGTRAPVPSALGQQPATETPWSTVPPESTASDTSSSVMRTLRQSDFQHNRVEDSPPMSPTLAGTPIALDSPSANVTGHAGGRVSRLLKSVRERSLARSSDGRAVSADRASIGSIDNHGEPSLAISQATAAGHVNSPIVSGEHMPTSPASSVRHSPAPSRPLSAVSSPIDDRLVPSGEVGDVSRTGSNRSITSLGKPATSSNRVSRSPNRPQSTIANESSPEQWQRADNERLRKLILESQEGSEPASTFDVSSPCPPSPDDHLEQQPDSRRMSALDISNHESSTEASPTSRGALLPAMASSTSDFGSSTSMSNPSIPSVLSEASSVDLTDPMFPQEIEKGSSDLLSSDDTVYARTHPRGVESEEKDSNALENEHGSSIDHDDSDSSDSDGGLVMSRRRSAAKPTPTKSSASHSHSLSASSRSSRRGSNSTTTRLSPGDSTDERQQPQASSDVAGS